MLTVQACGSLFALCNHFARVLGSLLYANPGQFLPSSVPKDMKSTSGERERGSEFMTFVGGQITQLDSSFLNLDFDVIASVST